MRIGIDMGGTKIAAIALGGAGEQVASYRTVTPRSYQETLTTLVHTVDSLGCPADSPVGLSLPGVVDMVAGTVKAANLPWLDGRALRDDLAAMLGRPVRLANDANCFVLSEAMDGAAAGAAVVFGVILGTGAGGGLVVNRQIIGGVNGVAGEWGHVAMPWRAQDDGPVRVCGCGRMDCIETVVSGAGLSRLHAHHHGYAPGETVALIGEEIAGLADRGDPAALSTLDRHGDALARALTMVVHLIDPEVIVIGGGLSGLPGLCERVSAGLARRSLAGAGRTRITIASHGAESGRRGAAWLW